MLLNILIAAVLMLMTVGIHAGGMLIAMSALRGPAGPLRQRLRRIRAYPIAEIVILMFYVSVVEVLLWAAAYVALDAIEDIEQAVYFSMVSFTTLGYGDVLLNERWRLLGSFEAANGIIMFGWTTALVIAAVQHVYFGESNNNAS
jgi:hypothetical protein